MLEKCNNGCHTYIFKNFGKKIKLGFNLENPLT